MTDSDAVATVETSLRLGDGLSPADLESVVAHFGSLDHRLRSFRPNAVELYLHIKERDTPSQRATLEAHIDGFPKLVATSTHVDYDDALIEVRDDMIRQITDAKSRREPNHNRRLRDKG
ncbi:MAG TPA: hypothetical protein VMW08_01450 [Acidimicrobiales bacterium]|nr:hypothetical protein [Acidimicrobiales bacterium]